MSGMAGNPSPAITVSTPIKCRGKETHMSHDQYQDEVTSLYRELASMKAEHRIEIEFFTDRFNTLQQQVEDLRGLICHRRPTCEMAQ